MLRHPTWEASKVAIKSLQQPLEAQKSTEDHKLNLETIDGSIRFHHMAQLRQQRLGMLHCGAGAAATMGNA